MSRRDGTIVAWHEVPGTTPPQKSRPVGYGVIRPGVRADRSAGISNTKTEKFMLYDLFQQTVYDIEPQLEYHRTPTFQEEHLALRNTSHISMRIPLGSLCPIIPYPTGRFFRGGDRGRDKVGFAPPTEPDWHISCIRLSSWWLAFKKIGVPQCALVLRRTSPPRRSRYLAIGSDLFLWPGLFVSSGA